MLEAGYLGVKRSYTAKSMGTKYGALDQNNANALIFNLLSISFNAQFSIRISGNQEQWPFWGDP